MRSYPTKGAWKLDEVAGVLHYQGQPIGAVADLAIPYRYDPENPHHYAGPAFAAARALLWQEGVPNPHLYLIYRCKNCRGWVIGSGSTACSEECRKAYRTQHMREWRAKIRAPAPEVCAHCGGSLTGQRTSRRYCSNRCRQAAYRKQQAPAEDKDMSEIDDELFMMTNLFPATTGLPMVVWVGPRYGARHDIRIKVMQAHGSRMDPGNLAVMALRPTPHVVAGHLSADDVRAVEQWIALNEAAIIDHWDGLTDGVQLGQQLRPLPP